MIPFLNLHKINARYDKEFKEVFDKFLNSGYYILGNELNLFEKKYASYIGSNYCIGVGNGLDALRLILEGYKVLGKLVDGDEVLVASNTYIATIIAIKQAGLVPVLVEAENKYYNFNISELKKYISKKSKVIMPVHLYGQIAPMRELVNLAKEHNLLIVEDAAQAHGAQLESGYKAGNLGNAAAFSFYPSKNLGALGDGGAITTNDEKLAVAVTKLRNYGTSSKYVNDLLGVNSRLDEIQAVFLSIKLASLDTDNIQRRVIAKRYIKEIINPKIKLPYYSGTNDHVFHLFVVEVKERIDFIEYLNKNKIGHLIHYPIPPNKQEALKELNHLSFPETERIHCEVVSLPMSPVMTSKEIETVINVVNA